MPTGPSSPVPAAAQVRVREWRLYRSIPVETIPLGMSDPCRLRCSFHWRPCTHYAQTKRAAASNADLPSGNEADHDDAGDRSPQQLADHGTSQPARQSRDHCKRAKADSGVAPECYVAALSLKNDDGVAIDTIEQKQLKQQLRLIEVLVRRGKHEEALRLLDNIIISNIVNAEALHLRGQCFAAKNNSAGVRCRRLHSPQVLSV